MWSKRALFRGFSVCISLFYYIALLRHCEYVIQAEPLRETDLLSVNANQSIHIKIKESSENNNNLKKVCFSMVMSKRALVKTIVPHWYQYVFNPKKQHVSIPYKT